MTSTGKYTLQQYLQIQKIPYNYHRWHCHDPRLGPSKPFEFRTIFLWLIRRQKFCLYLKNLSVGQIQGSAVDMWKMKTRASRNATPLAASRMWPLLTNPGFTRFFFPLKIANTITQNTGSGRRAGTHRKNRPIKMVNWLNESFSQVRGDTRISPTNCALYEYWLISCNVQPKSMRWIFSSL